MFIKALVSAFEYLLSVIPATIIGIVLMEFLIEMGWIQKLGFLTSPFMRFGHMREEVGISFMASFGSPTAGNSMVAELNKKGLINRTETILASLVISFPATFIFVRDLTPVLIILLRITGLIYLGIVVIVGLVRTILTLIIGHFWLPTKKQTQIVQEKKKTNIKYASKTAISNSMKPLRDIIPTMVIAAIVVFQLIDIGFFDIIANYLKGLPILRYIPAQGLPVIVAWFASNVGAYTIAGRLLTEGILSSKQIIITLLVGRVLSSFVRLRFTIPYYTGIFSPSVGTQIMILATLMEVAVTTTIIMMLYMFW